METSDDLPNSVRVIVERDSPRIISVPGLSRTNERVAEDIAQFGKFVLKVSVLARLQDKYAIVRHPDASGGEWSVPGGLVEPNEPIESAATREAKEETGLDISLGQAFAVIRARITSPNGMSMGYLRLLFQARVVGGELRVLDKHEIAEVKLATWEQIKELMAEGEFQRLPSSAEAILMKLV